MLVFTVGHVVHGWCVPPRMQEDVCRGCDVHWARDVWTAGVGTGVPQVLPGQHAQLHLLPTVHAQPQGHLTLMWPPPIITHSCPTTPPTNSKVVFSIHGYRRSQKRHLFTFHCPCLCSLFKVHSTLYDDTACQQVHMLGEGAACIAYQRIVQCCEKWVLPSTVFCGV